MSMLAALQRVFNGVTRRTPLVEDPTGSKNDLRYGPQGIKTNFPHSSTGQRHIEEIARDPNPLPASVAPRNRGEIGPARAEPNGWATDRSRRFFSASHNPNLIGNSVETHPSLEPKGLSKKASGIGKESKVPEGKNDDHQTIFPLPGTVRTKEQRQAEQAQVVRGRYRTVEDAGALAGDGGDRRGYTKPGGPIKP